MRRLGLYFLPAGLFLAAGAFAGWYLLSGADEPQGRSARPEQRARAAYELRQRSGSAARRKLQSLARDPEQKVAVQAIRSMAASGDRLYCDTLAELMAGSQAGSIRGQAAAALGMLKGVEAEPLLTLLRTDPCPKARAGAAQGLEHLSDKSAIPQLLEAMDDPDQEVRSSAVNAITQIVGRGVRFDFQAEWPAEKRREKIAAMRIILRKWGVLSQ